MKINSTQVTRVLNAYKSQSAKTKKVSKNSADRKDSVELSESAKSFKVALEAYKKANDVNSKKVQDLKKEISSGTYKVDADKVADSILESALGLKYRK